MKKTITFTAIVFVLAGTLPRGQQANVHVAFDAGRVTLSATHAPVGDVLAEWARVGGTVITGLDHVPPATVTLHLVAVEEKDAVEAVLGKTIGYAFASRTEAPAGTSLVTRLAIVAASTAPPAPAPAAQADATLPESRFIYPSPGSEGSLDDPDSIASKVRAARERSSAPPERLAMPEMRFQFPEPPVTAAEPDSKQ